MNNIKQHILEDLDKKIHTSRPISSWVIKWLQATVITFCSLLFLLSVSMVALFIFDFFEKQSIDDFLEEKIYGVSHLFFEWLVIAVLLAFLVVYLYRKFDWPFVKEKNKIFGIIIMASIISGFGLALFAKNNLSVRTGMHQVKSAYVATVPARTKQRVATHQALVSSRTTIGIVSSISTTTDTVELSLTTSQGTTTMFSIVKEKVLETIVKGEKVAVKVETDGITVEKIKIIK